MLEGIRVIEFAEGVAGPLACCRLADFGAEVIKIETGEGDWLRGAPPYLADGKLGAAFFALNRGKRSLAVGDASSGGAAVVRRLLDSADILVTDRDAEVLAQWGLAGVEQDQCPWNRQLVTVMLSAYGAKGPLAGKPGSELGAQAMAGYTRYVGAQDAPACRLGADVAGAATGIFAAQAVLAALLARGEAGGQRVDLSLLNSLLAMKTVQLAAQSDPDDYQGPRVGGANYPPERGWATADTRITFAFGGAVGAEGRPGWEQFIDVVGLSHLRDDPRFDRTGRNSTGLGSSVPELKPEYEARFADYPAREIVDQVRRFGGFASPYLTHAELFAEPQVEALGVVHSVPASDGDVSVLGVPTRFSGFEPVLRGHAPALGQHSREIARDLKFAEPEVEDLVACGAIADGGVPVRSD